MLNPAFVLENDTHKLLCDFDIQTRSYNNRYKKENCKIVDFAVPADHKIKLKER